MGSPSASAIARVRSLGGIYWLLYRYAIDSDRLILHGRARDGEFAGYLVIHHPSVINMPTAVVLPDIALVDAAENEERRETSPRQHRRITLSFSSRDESYTLQCESVCFYEKVIRNRQLRKARVDFEVYGTPAPPWGVASRTLLTSNPETRTREESILSTFDGKTLFKKGNYCLPAHRAELEKALNKLVGFTFLRWSYRADHRMVTLYAQDADCQWMVIWCVMSLYLLLPARLTLSSAKVGSREILLPKHCQGSDQSYKIHLCGNDARNDAIIECCAVGIDRVESPKWSFLDYQNMPLWSGGPLVNQL